MNAGKAPCKSTPDAPGTDEKRVYPFADAKRILAEKINNLKHFPREDTSICRVEVNIGPLDLVSWLAAQPGETKIFFSSREPQGRATAGTGAADTFFHSSEPDYTGAFEHMRKRLSSAFPRVAYFGGFAFAPGHIDSHWESFGACRFVVPRFELTREDGRTTLACNLDASIKQPSALRALLAQLETMTAGGSSPHAGPGQPVSQTDVPGHDQWVKGLAAAVSRIKAGDYKKTVLARRRDLDFKNPIDAPAVLDFLSRLPSPRYHFLFRFGGEHVFLGSSPERLYKRTGRTLLSEALAGTRSRCSLEQEDLRLAKELMDSRKEQQEHDFVVDTIREKLAPLCTSLDEDSEKKLVKLKEVQHLVLYFKGLLKDTIGDEHIMTGLHPTPAVGGCPLEPALEAIRLAEPFKRGWYAGAVGSVGRDRADFAVGLRSAMVYKNRLSLYSGVGVVEGSVPEAEWNELNCKITNFMDLLESTGTHHKK